MKMKNDRPKVGCAILVIRNGKVLLGKRKGGSGNGEYAAPGGHMEFAETLGDMVRRELKEETGLKAKNIRLNSLGNSIINGKHYVNIDFVCDTFPGEPKLMEPEKCESWDWYDLKKLPAPMFVTTKRAIAYYKKGIVLKNAEELAT